MDRTYVLCTCIGEKQLVRWFVVVLNSLLPIHAYVLQMLLAKKKK